MNGADIAVIICVLGVIAFAVWLTLRRRRKGSSCCGNCDGCSMCCDRDKEE